MKNSNHIPPWKVKCWKLKYLTFCARIKNNNPYILFTASTMHTIKNEKIPLSPHTPRRMMQRRPESFPLSSTHPHPPPCELTEPAAPPRHCLDRTDSHLLSHQLTAYIPSHLTISDLTNQPVITITKVKVKITKSRCLWCPGRRRWPVPTTRPTRSLLGGCRSIW